MAKNGNGNGSTGENIDLSQVQKIIELVEKSQISGLTVETEHLKVDVRKHGVAPTLAETPAPVVGVASGGNTLAPKEPVSAAVGIHEIKAPMVGTFYSSPNPESATFVKVGDTVQKGATVCIIEAMKLFNEIESDVSGTVEKILVQNGQGVEYGQALIHIRPNS